MFCSCYFYDLLSRKSIFVIDFLGGCFEFYYFDLNHFSNCECFCKNALAETSRCDEVGFNFIDFS
jgi:hypothetical protein